MTTKTPLAPRTSNRDAFQHRHIGPNAAAQDEMLRAIGVPSLDALIDQTIPSGIRFSEGLDLPPAETEAEFKLLFDIKNLEGTVPLKLGYQPVDSSEPQKFYSLRDVTIKKVVTTPPAPPKTNTTATNTNEVPSNP